MSGEEQNKGRSIWMGGTVNGYVVPAEYVIQLENMALQVVEQAIEDCGPCDKCDGGCPNTLFRDGIRESIRVNTESGVRK